jgi:hypothetical protein
VSPRTLLTIAARALVVGCSRKEHAGDTAERPVSARGEVATDSIGQFERVTTGSLTPLVLDSIAASPLGSDATTTPREVTRARIFGERIFVIDWSAHMVRAFHRSGLPIFSIPIDGRVDGLDNPMSLAVVRDTLYVLELNKERGITAFDLQGRRTRHFLLDIGSAAMDVTPVGDTLVVATSALDPDVARGRALLVRTVTREGTTLAAGCTPDPSYRKSVRRRGLLAMFRYVGVTESAGLLYCRQPATPVVQVLHPDGRAAGILRRAPPFYTPPPDVHESMNQVVIDRFRARWTEHTQFYPRPGGFLSVYSTPDSVTGAVRYRLFACDSTAGPVRCHVGESHGEPVAFVAPDTLVVLEPLRSAGQVRRLVWYRVQP